VATNGPGSPKPSQTACSRINTANGAVIGAGIGAIAGGLIFGKSGAVLAGGLIGAALGGIIGNDFDQRACAMEKIAAKSGTRIEQESIVWREPVAPAAGSSTQGTKDVPIGQITRWQDSGFATGSSELTAPARSYFTQVAGLYAPAPPDPQKLNQLQGTERDQYVAYVKARNEMPILLVGNTDDVGDSRTNQRLSEARAKSVGEVFQAAGIDPKRVFYWGAGETRPVADNRAEDGRSRNRRVDIIEFQDTDRLFAYLQSEKPNTQYYREAEPRPSPRPSAAPSPKPATKKAAPPPAASDEQAPGLPVAANTAGTAPTASAPEAEVSPAPVARSEPPAKKKASKAQVDFDGTPVTGALPSLLDQVGGPKLPVISLGLISSAFAAAPPAATCTEDRARQGGTVKSLATGKAISAYNTAEFLPGLNNVAWGAEVNDHLIALSGVGVVRSNTKPVSNPTVEIYPRWSGVSNKSTAKPTYTLATTVNTYEGKDGFIYRVFIESDQAPLSCLDILIPYSGFKAEAGRIHYYAGGSEYFANYAPKLLR